MDTSSGMPHAWKMSGRRSRGSFLLFLLLFAGIGALLGFLSWDLDRQSVFAIVLQGLLVWGSIWPASMLAGQRFRDFEWSGWWVLGLFVPPVNLFLLSMLLLKRGSRGQNRYGQSSIEI